MRKYTFVAPIEIRATRPLDKEPEYIAKGYINANIPDNYGTMKTPFGKKVMRSVFTDNAVDSMERQGKSKKLYVDSGHKIATHMNVERHLEELGISKKDKEQILAEIKVSDIPFSKLISITKDPTNESRLIVDTRLNPYYRNVDETHKNYFDAVWQSMEDKYINGISFDFAPTKVFEKEGITYIDDLELYGINYVGGQALPENTLFEVAMRATKEFVEGEPKMNDEKMKEMETKLVDAEKKLEEANTKVEGFEAKAKEATKAEVIKDKEELQKTVETMKTELEEIKKGKEGDKPIPPAGAQPVVPTEDKYNPKPPQNPELPTAEQLEAIKNFKTVLWENAQVKNQFPNRQDMFKGAPMKVNPEGDLTLGHLLFLQSTQPELFDQTIEGMDNTAKGYLFDKNSFLVKRNI